MKAVVYEKFGPSTVLQYKPVGEPNISKDQVLVAIKSSSVNPIDYKVRRGDLKGLMNKSFPKNLGSDFAGIVEKVGEHVSDLKVGDEVYGAAPPRTGGAYAQQLAISAAAVYTKPASLDFKESACLPVAALTALISLRDLGQIKKGQNVLINGCTGGVGVFAIQIAKYYGANVTGVCSTDNVSLAALLGADKVIDYKKDDLWSIDDSYHIFFDVASVTSLKYAKKLLKKNGVYINTLPRPESLFLWPLLNKFRSKKAKVILVKPNQEGFKNLNGIIDAIDFKVIIDKTFILDQIVAAHEYAESGKVVGKIALDVNL